MQTSKPIDWPARKARAIAHTRACVAERERVRGTGKVAKEIAYEYRDEDARQGQREDDDAT